MFKQAVALLFAAGCFAEVYRPGPQVLTFRSAIDDSDQPYALYLPKAFDPSRAYPLVISLHGEGSNHRFNLRQLFGRGKLPRESDADALAYFPPLRDVDFIVACPYARGTMGYRGIPEKDVYDVLADVNRRFRIDEERVYLTGVSMGGGGALWLALTRPDLWAAIAAVCPNPPEGTDDLLPNALDIPFHFFHGEQDPAVPVTVSRTWQKRLLDSGARVEYVEYPGIRHNAWDLAYKDGAIFDWFSKFRRSRFPERVRFVSRAYEYNSAYRVKFDGLTPGTPASIDARFVAANQLEIQTGNLDGFTLTLTGHPRFSTAAAVSLVVDGTRMRARSSGTVSLMRAATGWKQGLYQPPTNGKRPGAEGPISRALDSRHIYVYGTADSPSEDELQRRREVATHAAEWSTPRARLFVSFPVKADKDVTNRDLASANVILFGNKVTNRLIERFAPELPVELNAGAADYGLIFVAPAQGRYVVVSSGLPWWIGADEAKRRGATFMSPPFRILQTFPDYLLFKGSLENVVVEGLFDRNWKLPPEAAARMRETGTVVIR